MQDWLPQGTARAPGAVLGAALVVALASGMAACARDRLPDDADAGPGASADPDGGSPPPSPDAGGVHAGPGGGEPPAPPTTWSVEVASRAPEGVRWAAEDLVRYLQAMGVEASLREADGEVACLPGKGRAALIGDGLGASRVAALPEPTDQTWGMRESRCEAGGSLVELDGGGVLGRQYAAYEWLHMLGVRFFHPEQEHVPERPNWPAIPVNRQHTPAFRWRSVSLHLTHPLELGDAFRLGKPELLQEAKRYIDWQVKNGASFGTNGVGALQDEGLVDYGLRRGFPRSVGFSLHSQQQGGNAVIDPDDERTEEEQIAEAIEGVMAGAGEERPVFLGFTFNPSELTEIDDLDAVRQMTFIADHVAANHPGVILQTINHGSAGPPTANYGVRFHDLSKFAPSNLGVKVHPLMFFDLFRPAPVYGNDDFSFLFDFMVSEYNTRRLWYFPESAWWLTFDIAVPLYLPITMEARHRDIRGMAFMLEGRLDGHRVFGSGHEWGYWQNEWCSFRMAADLNYGYLDCLADITSPMGPAAPEVLAVLQRLIALQERDLVYGDILRYLVGSDTETEVAASIGIKFHPLPPAPSAILQWGLDELAAWRRRVAPQLERMATDYAALVARLQAVEGGVPERGRPWFDEILDGIEVSGLRARHAAEVHGALVDLGEARLRFDSGLEARAEALLATAKATTANALEVIHRREASYRYAPIERSIAGGPLGTEDENWTIYKYRYLNRTHHAFYWTRTDDLATAAFEGTAEVLRVEDSLLGPGEILVVEVTDPDIEGVTVDFGDETAEAGAAVEHTYGAPGVYDLRVTGVKGGAPFERGGRVAALAEEHAAGFTGTVLEPAGAVLVQPVLPSLVLGRIDAERLALGFGTDETGQVGLGRWTLLPAAPGDALIRSAPTRLVVPIVNRPEARTLSSLVVEEAEVLLQTAEGPILLTGLLSTDAVVDSLVAIGGFEPVGARAAVAQALGFTPETLPARVPFVVQYALGLAPEGEGG